MSVHETQDGAVETVFKREERFIVVKRKHLNALQETALRAHMARLDIGTVECVVVESNWPEYETVWGMIEDRVTGCTAMPDQGKLVEEMTKALERSRELLHASESFASACADYGETVYYDGADCDGYCLAEDCMNYAEVIDALLTRARKIGGGE
jgi:hypothetical protein